MNTNKEVNKGSICNICGTVLKQAPARFDGEATFVGYLPHECKPVNKQEDMTVQEFYSGFNLDFLSDEEKQTIYTATELYAKGKLRQSFIGTGVLSHAEFTCHPKWDEVHDQLKDEGYSTGSEEDYDKLYNECKKRIAEIIKQERSIDTGVEEREQEVKKFYAEEDLSMEFSQQLEKAIVNSVKVTHETILDVNIDPVVELFKHWHNSLCAKWASSGEAVEFAEWIAKNQWKFNTFNRNWYNEKDNPVTTEMLYQLFKQKP